MQYLQCQLNVAAAPTNELALSSPRRQYHARARAAGMSSSQSRLARQVAKNLLNYDTAETAQYRTGSQWLNVLTRACFVAVQA